MAVNPDPKPGRWILPLVILGMIAFTYFFVRELPAASPDTTLAGPTTITAPDSTTSTLGNGNGVVVDPATQAYLDEVDAINAELQVHNTDLVAANTGFDADPRTVEYSDAEARFEAVDVASLALVDRFNALTPPLGLEVNHQALQAAIEGASRAAGDAIAGLRSDDPGELRRSSVEAYVQAVEDFNNEVTNLRTAAGV